QWEIDEYIHQINRQELKNKDKINIDLENINKDITKSNEMIDILRSKQWEIDEYIHQINRQELKNKDKINIDLENINKDITKSNEMIDILRSKQSEIKKDEEIEIKLQNIEPLNSSTSTASLKATNINKKIKLPENPLNTEFSENTLHNIIDLVNIEL
ncbi:unnamed protein product, partial [marine sediment metagenome]